MPLSYVVLDFETASAVDLKKAGSWRYSEDPTTEVLCLAWQHQSNKEPTVWVAADQCDGQKVDIWNYACDPEVTFIAHNTGFEKAIWRNIMVPVYGWPDIPNSRWHDSLAVCAMKAIPMDLERVVKVLRLPYEKDMEGNKLTLSLSKPNKRGYYDRSPQILERVGAYCAHDVCNQVALHARLGWLPQGERKVWLLDQRINERGVKLDLDFVAAGRLVVERASIPLRREFSDLTNGLKETQGAKFLAWCLDQGVKLPNMRKETLAEVLGISEEDDDESFVDISAEQIRGELSVLPTNVRRALTIRQLIGSASIKKLSRMEQCVCEDGRARGLLQYHGAGPGRWAGRLLQPHNFPRGTVKDDDGLPPDPERMVHSILTGDPDHVEAEFGCGAVEAVVSSLRHAIIASDGRALVAGDFAGIEARVVLALAGQSDVLAVIKEKGSRQAYLDMASKIFKRPIDKNKDPEEYVIGKNSILGCGFQMGWETFQRRYAKAHSDEVCKGVIDTYRREYAPCVPKLWEALGEASFRAVADRVPQEAFGVTYALEDVWLTARLPSGRKLWYYGPQLDRKAMPWDPMDVRPCWSYFAMKMGQWKKVYSYGGIATENVVQALARDLMVHAMFTAEKENMPLILTVHDELITEPTLDKADPKVLEQIMCDIPDWAKALDIPIAADAWTGSRYKK